MLTIKALNEKLAGGVYDAQLSHIYCEPERISDRTEIALHMLRVDSRKSLEKMKMQR